MRERWYVKHTVIEAISCRTKAVRTSHSALPYEALVSLDAKDEEMS